MTNFSRDIFSLCTDTGNPMMSANCLESISQSIVMKQNASKSQGHQTLHDVTSDPEEGRERVDKANGGCARCSLAHFSSFPPLFFVNSISIIAKASTLSLKYPSGLEAGRDRYNATQRGSGQFSKS